MLNHKNGMFTLSIVTLSIAGILFIGTFLARYANGSVWLYLDIAFFIIPTIILATIALIRGIIYLVRKVPKSIETVIMSSIAIGLLFITAILIGFLIGTGRLPHEIFF